jgi:hypothetical protein
MVDRRCKTADSGSSTIAANAFNRGPSVGGSRRIGWKFPGFESAPAIAHGETPARTYAKTALLIPQTYFRCLFMTIQSRCNHAPNCSIVRRGRRERNVWSSRIDGDSRHSFLRSPNDCPCCRGDGHVWLTPCR